MDQTTNRLDWLDILWRKPWDTPQFSSSRIFQIPTNFMRTSSQISIFLQNTNRFVQEWRLHGGMDLVTIGPVNTSGFIFID